MQSSGFTNHFLNPAGRQIQVEMQRLDEYIDEYFIESIDVLKMDIEGMEFEVLMDLPEIYFEKIKSIVLEYHILDESWNAKLDQLLARLKKYYKNVNTLPNKYSDKLGYIFCY